MYNVHPILIEFNVLLIPQCFPINPERHTFRCEPGKMKFEWNSWQIYRRTNDEMQNSAFERVGELSYSFEKYLNKKNLVWEIGWKDASFDVENIIILFVYTHLIIAPNNQKKKVNTFWICMHIISYDSIKLNSETQKHRKWMILYFSFISIW